MIHSEPTVDDVLRYLKNYRQMLQMMIERAEGKGVDDLKIELKELDTVIFKLGGEQ